MNCDKMNDLMSAWLDGELTQAEEREMEEHLNHCPECQAVFAQLQGLHTSFSDLEELEPSSDFSQRVMAQIQQESKSKVISFPGAGKGRMWRSVAALAACAVLAVGIGNMDSLMGGAAAPTVPAAAVPESAMMAPEMAKAMDGLAFDVPAAAEESAPAEYSMSVEAPVPAPHSEEPGGSAAKQESTGNSNANPIYRPAQSETGAEQEWQANMDSRYEFILDWLPEDLEESMGSLVWETRPFDGARYARLTLEQGELLQELLEQSGRSFTQRMVRPHGRENVLIYLPE